MSLFRYKVMLDDRDGDAVCFVTNNFFGGEVDEKLDTGEISDWHHELDEHGELEYEYYGGLPICYILKWIGKELPKESADYAYNQLGDMAERKRTPWRLWDINLYQNGTVVFDFDLANPSGERPRTVKTSQSHYIHVGDDDYFRIVFETRSDGFARTRYAIKRQRFKKPWFENETVIEVVERSESCLRNLAFHFPDNGNAYCEVTECRR